MADRAEVPGAPQITEAQIGAKDPILAVHLDVYVFHVRVVDIRSKIAEVHDGINALPEKMAGVIVDAERLVEMQPF